MLSIPTVARTCVLMASALLAGCADLDQGPFEAGRNELPAQVLPDTMTSAAVRGLPAPQRQLTVAVYEFPDLTGQHKPNSNFAEYSRAVTQGADAVLVDVLTEAGNGAWFKVVERRGLSNVLRERQIIQATRQEFEGEDAAPLNPLTFAGVLVEGGVVSYESNVRTGGVGARYLGVGANTEYQEDYVTVALRLVSVTSGDVILSVTTTKQIYSTLVQGNVFRYVSTDSLLDLDAGFTRNSPPQFALREAIELAVFALVMEGRERNLWNFRNPSDAAGAAETYIQRRSTLNSSAPVTTSSLNTPPNLEPVSIEVVNETYLEPDTVDLISEEVARTHLAAFRENGWLSTLHARTASSGLSFSGSLAEGDVALHSASDPVTNKPSVSLSFSTPDTSVSGKLQDMAI